MGLIRESFESPRERRSNRTTAEPAGRRKRLCWPEIRPPPAPNRRPPRRIAGNAGGLSTSRSDRKYPTSGKDFCSGVSWITRRCAVRF